MACIIRQSTFSEGAQFQQLSNLYLEGINTTVGVENTDHGRLFASLSLSGGTYTFTLYKDFAKLDEVASGSTTTLGTITISEVNASGLSGSVNLAQFVGNDTMIEIWCLFAQDSDLPMVNLTGLNDYDNLVGFASFHIQAFNKIVEIITSRNRSQLWNPKLIDANNLNGALGGFDLSRFNNLEVLREPARHYALMLICERQVVEPGSVFDVRQKDSRMIFKANMETLELTFDTFGDRVATAARTLSTFSTGR